MVLVSYLLRVLISIDQLGNTLADGNPDETISSRVGRAALEGRWWARFFAEPVIDGLFRLVAGQRGHCRASIEWDEQ